LELANNVIPTAFFVTGGKAIGKVSELNTFDLALKEAGIEQCNLVAVSSIIPPDCKETKPRKLPIGAITYVVLSKADGQGEMLSAGIAWGKDENSGYGIVAEAYGHTDEAATKKKLDAKVQEMARIRNIKIGNVKYRIETIDVPKNYYGCAVAALVYIFQS
jgi:arginine decarboxylase